MDTPWPVEIRPIGLAACATTVWRFRGQLQVTVIVKSTFSFVPAGAMAIEEPDDILEADVHREGAGLWAASELQPYRRLADVVLVGHAHVAPGRGLARLAVFHEETPLDKTIRVESRRGGAVPLAGFGPVARTWPEPAALGQPIADVPEHFDWSYLQAAPPDQRTAFLHGDEWILLEGLHPEHAVMQMRLPDVSAAGRIYGLGSGALPIAFHGDSLHLDTDRQRCSLTFRGHFPVPDRERLATIVVLAGVEIIDRPLRWPESVQLLPTEPDATDEDAEFGMATLPFQAAEPRAGRQSTMLLTWPEGGPPPLQTSSARQVTEALRWPAGGPPPLFEDPDASTVEIRTKAPRPPALPFQPAAEAPAPAEPAASNDDPWRTSTVTLGQAAVPRPMAAPFQLAAPGEAPSGPQVEIPGAPWASSPAAAVPSMPRGRLDTLTTVEPMAPPARAAAGEDLVDEPTPPPPARAPDAPPERPWSWATTAEPAGVEVTAPAPRPPAPAIKVQRSIYERFNSTGKK